MFAGKYFCFCLDWPNQLKLVCTVLIFSTANASVITNLTDITNATENSPVSLQCSNPDEAEVYSWNYTPSNPLESVKSVQGSSIYNVTSSKLTGYYSCFLGADLVSKFQAINFSNPLLYHETEVIYAGKSLVLTDGDLNQTVECVSYSYPFPEFVWSISFPDEEPKVLSNVVSGSFSVFTNSSKSSLTISHVDYHKRASYKCSVSNAASSKSASFLLRVHGKFAALWPFLGIVFEILIVASIILVVRRKRFADDISGSLGRRSTSSDSLREDVALKVRFRKTGPSRNDK